MTLVHFLGPDGQLVPVSADNPLPTGSGADAAGTFAAASSEPETATTDEGTEESP